MKRLFFIISLLLISGISFAQNKAAAQKASETSVTEGAYLMDAAPLLEKFYKANGIDLVQLSKSQPVLKKTTAWNFNVGDTHSWWAQDLTDNQFYLVPSTCRGVSAPGGHCYVFVEDSSWANGRVDQNAVNQIINAFDNSTPANSNKGVYQTDVDTFGNPPDVDNDPKIIIFILNIRDGYVQGSASGYTAGYFSGYNESAAANSNQSEFYYMDCNPMNLKNSSSLATALQITAHEFQHMIQWNYHGNVNGPNHTNNRNDDFFNEGCSMIAEVVCGYPLRLQSYYSATSATNVYMIDWNKNPPGNVLSDYARAARFFLYIKEQFGISALTKFVQSPLTDFNAFNISVFPALGSTRRFNDVVADWWVANVINNKSADPKWGYDYAGLGTVSFQTMVNPNLSNFTESVYKYGVKYYKFTSGSNLNVNLNTKGNTSIKMKAIKIGSSTVASDLTTNANNNIPDFGTTYPNLILMIYHNDQNEFPSGPFSFSINSTGTFQHTVQELAYIKTEPIGTGGGSDKDTSVIYFSGVMGAKLDSIKVALRQAGSLQGYVWKYTGNARPTPLGAKISGAFTATSNIATRPPSPYPPVWPNWVKVDLRSLNIDASNDFVIGFINNGDYTGTNAGSNSVMLSPSPSGTHSYMYLHKPGGTNPANWYYIVDSNSDYTEFLVYAYVSFGTSDVKQVVELTPTSYRLNQNYPNPFNPSTVINYQLPKGSFVTLKVYDMLGREVATLVDEYQNAGTHNSQFSILNSELSSGVYFYTIKADNYVETKKMILMK